MLLCSIEGDESIHVFASSFQPEGSDTSKNLVRDSKSFDFIEISLISCDFSDFNDFVKHLKLAISKEKLVQIILIGNQTFKFITKHRSAQFKDKRL